MMGVRSPHRLSAMWRAHRPQETPWPLNFFFSLATRAPRLPFPFGGRPYPHRGAVDWSMMIPPDPASLNPGRSFFLSHRQGLGDA